MMDRRSGIDSRTEAEKRLIGERRSGISGHLQSESPPSSEQLALFARRMRRVMRDERGRHLLGVAIGEGDFTIFPEVVRVVNWIERLAGANGHSDGRTPSLQNTDASD